ncbi:hypothetical protein KPSA3_04282 [Pseudomonas syringae pv. actinidiae]|uniref:Uncharacterized protein n=1 Tax=Pseudomonas syringae pv. actinidiae TaxID=103796 RepID=A0AAN4TMM0_PSESF|nr:hypothetical protein KPSA3_04282 [Pseudomonas syringae pv. actinidiae]
MSKASAIPLRLRPGLGELRVLVVFCVRIHDFLQINTFVRRNVRNLLYRA